MRRSFAIGLAGQGYALERLDGNLDRSRSLGCPVRGRRWREEAGSVMAPVCRFLAVLCFASICAGCTASDDPSAVHSVSPRDLPSLTSLSDDAKIYYVSPRGAGNGSGISPVDALPASELQNLLRGARGDVAIRFLGGRYRLQKTLVIPDRGPEAVTVLEGEGQNTEFIGDFNYGPGTEGHALFRLAASNVAIRNMQIRNMRTCVAAASRVPLQNVLLERIWARDVHDCIMVYKNPPRFVANWLIREIDVRGYYRVGIRLAGANTKGVVISNVYLDGANGADRHYCFKGGIQLLKGVRDVRVEDAVIKNNVGDCEGYQQGDGIEADHKGGTPSNLRFENVLVSNSRDGNFDLKAKGVHMSNVTSLRGAKTRYAFRFWGYDDYLCEKCRSDGADTAYIFSSGASTRFVDPDFHAEADVKICDLRSKSKQKGTQSIVFEGGSMASYDGTSPSGCSSQGTLESAVTESGERPLRAASTR